MAPPTTRTGPPVFVLAPPRSFTSVAAAMLGQHPALYALPEVNLFAADTVGELLTLFRRRPGLGHGLLRAVAELGLGSQTHDDVASALDWLRENTSLSVGQAFAVLTSWAAPRRLVDKSPLYALHNDALDRLMRDVPDARFIHLTRHPVTACASVVRFRDAVSSRLGATPDNRASRPRPSDMQRFWLQPHLQILAFLDGVPNKRQLRVQGERLLKQPETELRRMAHWLQIDTSTIAISGMLHPERSPFACEGPANARYGNDPEFLKRPALRSAGLSPAAPVPDSLPAAVQECAKRLGYHERQEEQHNETEQFQARQ